MLRARDVEANVGNWLRVTVVAEKVSLDEREQPNGVPCGHFTQVIVR